MSHEDEWPSTTRRTFLRGCLAATGALAVAACGGGPASGGGAPRWGGGPGGAGSSPLAPPDLPWSDPNIPPAYLKLPAPFQATGGSPGSGGPLTEVTWFSDEFSPPPPPLPGNRYWAELNRRLGLKVTPIWGPADQASYEQKFAAILASGDLPDLVLFSGTTGTAAQAQALQQGAFTDLTHHLSGSALKDYPNLALIAPKIWQNSRINGKIYGVPRGRAIPGATLLLRSDWAEKVGVPLSQLTTTAAFQEAMVDVAGKDPDGNGRADTWGIPDIRYIYSYFAEMFGAPNNWRLGKDGSLVKDIEAAENRQAITYARTLFQKGASHPHAPPQTLPAPYTLFETGRGPAYPDP